MIRKFASDSNISSYYESLRSSKRALNHHLLQKDKRVIPWFVFNLSCADDFSKGQGQIDAMKIPPNNPAAAGNKTPNPTSGILYPSRCPTTEQINIESQARNLQVYSLAPSSSAVSASISNTSILAPELDIGEQTSFCSIRDGARNPTPQRATGNKGEGYELGTNRANQRVGSKEKQDAHRSTSTPTLNKNANRELKDYVIPPFVAKDVEKKSGKVNCSHISHKTEQRNDKGPQSPLPQTSHINETQEISNMNYLDYDFSKPSTSRCDPLLTIKKAQHLMKSKEKYMRPNSD